MAKRQHEPDEIGAIYGRDSKHREPINSERSNFARASLTVERTSYDDNETGGDCAFNRQQVGHLQRPRRLLSLDGGGVRGLSSLIILKHIMNGINEKRLRGDELEPWQVFDMIGGTSTGGIIAIMLGRLRMTLAECEDVYLQLSKKIFTPRRYKHNILGQGKDFLQANGKFDSRVLQDSIRECIRKKHPDDVLLKDPDLACRVFVVATRENNAELAIFRSYKNSKGSEPLFNECKVWEACCATSAATTFFDPIAIGKFGQTFADGGILYNNPIQLIDREAKTIWPGQDAMILSIGTGSAPNNSFTGNLKNIVEAMSKILTQTERTANDFYHSHTEMVKDNLLFRFNVTQGLADVGLEEYKEVPRIADATETYLDHGETGEKLTACIEKLSATDTKVKQSTTLVTSFAAQDMGARRQLIIAWLSPLEFLTTHNNTFNIRQEGTGQWFLESVEFNDWVYGPRKTLWCSGIPGAGKTVLASIVIDHLLKTFKDDDDVGTAFIYCTYEDKDKVTHTPINLIASLWMQLVSNTKVTEQAIDLYNTYTRWRGRPSLQEVLKVFYAEVARYSRVFIIIDALDELSEDMGIRDGFLAELRLLPATVRVLITSRTISDISRGLNDTNYREICASEGDIRKYLTSYIANLHSCVKENASLQEIIISNIIQSAKGMFLLAKLHIESLRDKFTPRHIQTALKDLPKGSNALECAYTMALKRIDGQMEGYRDIANQVLAWVTYARRPLSVLELRHALAVFLGDTTLDKEGLPDESTFTNHCAGLISIEGESRTVHLVHYTAQEFFERILPVRNPQAHTNIAATCLTYLSFDIFTPGECDTVDEMKNRLHENPFLAYAAKYWSDHARRGSEDQVKDLILNFFNQQSNLSCCIQANRYEANCRYFPEDNTINGVLIRLRSTIELQRGGGYNQYRLGGKTKLHIAASFGLRSIVRLLLEEGADVAARDDSGMTALHIAAAEGFAEIVQLLPGSEASKINSEESYTPLEMAMARDQEGVVRVFLERDDAKPDTIFEEQTLLTWAAKKGHVELIRLILLGNDVRADSKDESGRTALSYAAEMGHGDVVRLLFKRDDVDADSRDDLHGRTPLSFAAERGHTDVVRLLLERLERDSVRPDSTYLDEFGDPTNSRSALSWAAGEGHEGTVQLLLARDDVNIDSFDDEGCTPLLYAVVGEHERVVQQLIEGGAKVDAVDFITALGHSAAGYLDEGVRMLLKYGADIEARDGMGHTAIDKAINMGHVSAVQLLLENKALLNVGSDGGTALHQINFNCNDQSIRRFIEREQGGSHPNVIWQYEKISGFGCTVEPKRRVQISLEDGRTEWSWTARGGHKEMIELLLKNGVEIEAKDIYGRTALLTAVIEGHEVVLRLLLEKGADINTIDGNGQTALHWAASNMNQAMVEILLENGIDVTPICDEGSAMHFAASNGQETMLRMLLAKGAEIDAVDKWQMTALSCAVIEGHFEIAELLINEGAAVKIVDAERMTPLSWAMANSDEPMVRLLSSKI